MLHDSVWAAASKAMTPVESIPDRLVLPRCMGLVCVSTPCSQALYRTCRISMKILRVFGKCHKDDYWTRVFLYSVAHIVELKLMQLS